MRQSLQTGGVDFVPNSLFIWNMFQSAGWAVDFEPVEEFLNGRGFRTVTQPTSGDVVVYLRDGVPYHAGLLEAENQIVSSTLNAGIVRTPAAAFAGEVRYVRLVEPEPMLSSTAAAPIPTAAERQRGRQMSKQAPAKAQRHSSATKRRAAASPTKLSTHKNVAKRRGKHAAQHREHKRKKEVATPTTR